MQYNKFRARPLGKNNWVYGELRLMSFSSHIIDEHFRHHYIDLGTIGRFINLRDKYMKEMYEGDIVQDENGAIGYIGYLQEEMGFCIIWDHSYSRLGIRTRGGGYEVDPSLEIIGNVHDNPKLLTNKELL